MAREAGLSRFHFCRYFKKFTGMTPKKFLCRLRLEKARILLSNPEKRISEIAIEVGFDDLSNFIRHFKKYTGFTPGSYRKEFYNIDNIE
jgi:AraC family transcriptional regulator